MTGISNAMTCTVKQIAQAPSGDSECEWTGEAETTDTPNIAAIANARAIALMTHAMRSVEAKFAAGEITYFGACSFVLSSGSGSAASSKVIDVSAEYLR